ncbi:hypothetical protein [Haloarchaeobius sp. TZWSO28]|uniref:hypothetical protein n=1 Tax=unclassified Haloarchaeobius TaxID=2614452 RepID=UPI003EB86F40
MTETDSSDRLAQLFVDITGETTTTERQTEAVHGVVDDEVTTDVRESLRATGLEDTLSEPDTG